MRLVRSIGVGSVSSSTHFETVTSRARLASSLGRVVVLRPIRRYNLAMSRTAAEILEEARQLPPSEREWVAEGLLIDSAEEIEPEWAAEVERQESPLTADRFLAEVGLSLKRIAAHPKLYPPYSKNTRRRVLGSFPFSVVYRETADSILIVAIAHAKRREGYWAMRLRRQLL